ncbi:MAG: [FeFe] hydrogenase H-cluster maturation GTPase HydF [Prolixibacteraceae bacterium]|nr:[FeFe] hydrogenase H-cluster maturation GTPase HydF [Prolixibacteraceae bacterium]
MKTPKTFRLRIGIFGRRNVGKSSLLNALTGQEVSIVSDVAGTTTDPVEKSMEFLSLGPVVFLDTAGIDDGGKIGEKRVAKTMEILNRTDVGIIVTGFSLWGEHEEKLVDAFTAHKISFLVVFNKTDLFPENPGIIQKLETRNIAFVKTQADKKRGIEELREKLIELTPCTDAVRSPLLADLVGAGEMAVLIAPVDSEAPKGRLILPQVQSIRDLLDHDAFCIVVKDDQFEVALSRLNKPPKLVVTDSQAFEKIAKLTPPEIPLTSFSILFARLQADLGELVQGAEILQNLQPGDKILIAEACTHHPTHEDIATVKIPRFLKQYADGGLIIDYVRGHRLPKNLADYKLMVHCGACMWNRRAMLSRMAIARQAGVPVTNYGLVIAFALNIQERALTPFSPKPPNVCGDI